MAIRRGPLPQDAYVIIERACLRDPHLSYKAKGILAYIMSHSSEYELSTEQMIAESKDQKASVRSGIRELIDGGYLVREPRRDPTTGRLDGYDYVIASPHKTAAQTGGRKSASGSDQGKHTDEGGASGDRKSVAGSEQGKQGKPAAHTGGRFSGAGKPATKKKKVLEDKREDQSLSARTSGPGDNVVSLAEKREERSSGKKTKVFTPEGLVSQYLHPGEDAARFVDAIVRAHNVRSPVAWFPGAEKNGTLADRVAEVRAALTATAEAPVKRQAALCGRHHTRQEGPCLLCVDEAEESKSLPVVRCGQCGSRKVALGKCRECGTKVPAIEPVAS